MSGWEILQRSIDASAGGGEDAHHIGFGERQERLDDQRIELRATGFDEAARGFVERQAAAIRARGNHGVEGINHGDDAGADGDLRFLQLRGIAGAVEIFMMVEDEKAGAFEAGKTAKDSPTEFRMTLDDRVFFVGEASGLVEDAVGNADFADVVKESAHFDVRHGAFGNAKLARDAESPFGEAGAVDAGIQVAQIEELVEGANEGVAKVVRVGLELLDAQFRFAKGGREPERRQFRGGLEYGGHGSGPYWRPAAARARQRSMRPLPIP